MTKKNVETQVTHSLKLLNYLKRIDLIPLIVGSSIVLFLSYLETVIYWRAAFIYTFVTILIYLMIDYLDMEKPLKNIIKMGGTFFILMTQHGIHAEYRIKEHQAAIYQKLINKSDIHAQLVPHYKNCQYQPHKTTRQSECLVRLKVYADAIELKNYQLVFKDIQNANW